LAEVITWSAATARLVIAVDDVADQFIAKHASKLQCIWSNKIAHRRRKWSTMFNLALKAQTRDATTILCTASWRSSTCRKATQRERELLPNTGAGALRRRMRHLISICSMTHSKSNQTEMWSRSSWRVNMLLQRVPSEVFSSLNCKADTFSVTRLEIDKPSSYPRLKMISQGDWWK
jgi:hypothetical protein